MSMLANLSTDCLQELSLEGGLGLRLRLLGRRRGFRGLLSFSLPRLGYDERLLLLRLGDDERLLQGDGVVFVQFAMF